MMFKTIQYSSLAGNVITENYDNNLSVIEQVEQSKITYTTYDFARNKADIALSKMKISDGSTPGSKYQVGTGFKQIVRGEVYWVFTIDFAGFFKWNNDKQVPGYIMVSAEKSFADPQIIQKDIDGNEIHEIYLRSAYFGNNALRYLRNNGYLHENIFDGQFEVDDNLVPYYVFPVMENTIGYFGEVLKGTILLNTQNGKIEYYEKNKQPDWVDCSFPINTLTKNVKSWAKYANEKSYWKVLFNPSKAQQPNYDSSGEFNKVFWSLLCDKNGKLQWFATMTSSSTTDEAITGFILCDANNGEIKYYKTNGITQDTAIKTAKSHWTNFSNYNVSNDILIYNIYGTLTYCIPIEADSQLKGLSLVSIKNVSVNGKGVSIEEALASYRASMIKADDNNSINAPSGLNIKELSGVVERVGFETSSNQVIMYNFKIIGVNKSFQAIYSELTPEILYIRDGDKVHIKYIDTASKVESCQSFDIIGLDL